MDLGVSIKELRAEAINWVKKIGKGECGSMPDGTDLAASESYYVCEVLKSFFNLTEEDLK